MIGQTQWHYALILILGSVICFCWVSSADAQTENFGPLKFTPPKGFVRKANRDAIVFSRVDRWLQRFCYLTLYAAVASADPPKKSFEKEWAERVVSPWGAGEKPDAETELFRRLTFTSAGSEIYIDGNKAMAYLSVVNGYGRSASLLGIFNDNSCLASFQSFSEEIDIDKNR